MSRWPTFQQISGEEFGVAADRIGAHAVRRRSVRGAGRDAAAVSNKAVNVRMALRDEKHDRGAIVIHRRFSAWNLA